MNLNLKFLNINFHTILKQREVLCFKTYMFSALLQYYG